MEGEGATSFTIPSLTSEVENGAGGWAMQMACSQKPCILPFMPFGGTFLVEQTLCVPKHRPTRTSPLFSQRRASTHPFHDNSFCRLALYY